MAIDCSKVRTTKEIMDEYRKGFDNVEGKKDYDYYLEKYLSEKKIENREIEFINLLAGIVWVYSEDIRVKDVVFLDEFSLDVLENNDKLIEHIIKMRRFYKESSRFSTKNNKERYPDRFETLCQEFGKKDMNIELTDEFRKDYTAAHNGAKNRQQFYREFNKEEFDQARECGK